jgi:hypothetical protein
MPSHYDLLKGRRMRKTGYIRPIVCRIRFFHVIRRLQFPLLSGRGILPYCILKVKMAGYVGFLWRDADRLEGFCYLKGGKQLWNVFC